MNEKVINQYKLQIKIITDKNIELQQRIDEAIEYIHWRYDDREDMYITQMEELLEILGDKDGTSDNQSS